MVGITRRGESPRADKATSAGVNFINVLRTTFALVDPKSVKDTEDLTE